MSDLLLKCPKCRKRGVKYTSGAFRGVMPSLSEFDGDFEKLLEARERAQAEQTTWNLCCRFCGWKQTITHPELLKLQDSDPVFLRRRKKQLEKLPTGIISRTE